MVQAVLPGMSVSAVPDLTGRTRVIDAERR
jgi:hypothetical protein